MLHTLLRVIVSVNVEDSGAKLDSLALGQAFVIKEPLVSLFNFLESGFLHQEEAVHFGLRDHFLVHLLSVVVVNDLKFVLDLDLAAGLLHLLGGLRLHFDGERVLALIRV